jgi:hypothetical protein
MRELLVLRVFSRWFVVRGKVMVTTKRVYAISSVNLNPYQQLQDPKLVGMAVKLHPFKPCI